MRAPHRCGNWTIPVTARHTAHYLSRIIMNWFVNENTCFPPLASIYAFYRVHLATPFHLSRSILHSPSFRPSLRGASSSPSHAFTPRDNPPRPVPLSFCLRPRCLRLSVFTAYILSWWRCGVMAICGGRRAEEGGEERKIVETCVRNCLRLDRCGFPSEL